MNLAHAYSATVFALGALAALMFIQLLLADVIGLRSSHVPGSQVPTDHDSLLFRASRTVANSNESIAIFILAVSFCLLSGASAGATAYSSWAFFVARFLYAVCYYLNLKLLRSTAFGLSLVGLLALLITGMSAWI